MAKARDLVAVARSQLGVKEQPPKSNRVVYNTWYYGREVSGSAYPWCMAFVQWCAHQAGVPLPVKTASCGALMRAAKTAGLWVGRDALQLGDIVIYDFPGGAATDHCGIVEHLASSGIVAIEGNTGSTSDADGGQVQRRTRALHTIVGAVRPKYDGGVDAAQEDTTAEEVETVPRYNTVAECPDWARETVQKLIDRGHLTGDRTGLDLSHDMVRILVVLDRAGVYR